MMFYHNNGKMQELSNGFAQWVKSPKMSHLNFRALIDF